jgi:hypothetical protein
MGTSNLKQKDGCRCQIFKKLEKAYFKVLSLNGPGKIQANHVNLQQDSQHIGPEQKHQPPKYVVITLTTE